MSIHAITFRIHRDDTYASRYESVVNAVKMQSTGGRHWAEPTSFFLIESDRSSKQIAEAIDETSLFADRDLLLVINLSHKGYTAIGNVTDRDLHLLMGRR